MILILEIAAAIVLAKVIIAVGAMVIDDFKKSEGELLYTVFRLLVVGTLVKGAGWWFLFYIQG